MSVHLSEPLIAIDEIPESRRYVWSDEKLDHAVEAGIFSSRAEANDRLSLDQYLRLDETGILSKYDHVELLGGCLVANMTIHPPHQTATRLTQAELDRHVPEGWFVDRDAPIAMPVTDSVPQPDLVVIRGTRRDYSKRHPHPGDVALVVEVADSSLGEDRGFQKRLYAFEGVAVYWIVNLVDLQIEVYRDPSGQTVKPDYHVREVYRAGESIPWEIDGKVVGTIAASDLLP